MGIIDDESINAFKQIYRQHLEDERRHQEQMQKVRDAFSGLGGQGSTIGGGIGGAAKARPKWDNLAQMNFALNTIKANPKPKKKTPEQRRREINRELDIIRGRVETPKGYKIDTGRARLLLKELKELEGK